MDPALAPRVTLGWRNMFLRFIGRLWWQDGPTQVASSRRDYTFFANLPPCLVGMEASNGAHFWAKAISELRYDVRLISPQFVTPYVKSNRNDRNGAEAICEAVKGVSMTVEKGRRSPLSAAPDLRREICRVEDDSESSLGCQENGFKTILRGQTLVGLTWEGCVSADETFLTRRGVIVTGAAAASLAALDPGVGALSVWTTAFSGESPPRT
jgi:hypothetical protein